MNSHSDYDVNINVSVLTIVDINKGNKSVTNDIENILAKLKLDGVLDGIKSVFYRDSDGRYDEVMIDEAGKFLGFRLLSTNVY